MAVLTCTNLKIFPVISTTSAFIAILLPYVIAVTRNHVRTFLPYVTHAAGFPPQSAIYSIFMTLAALFGVLSVILRYVALEHRRNRMQPPKVRILNNADVWIGIFAYLSLLLASHFPVAFVTHEKFDWVYFVIVPHFVASAFMVTAFTLYIMVQSYLTYALRKRSALNVSIHATLAMTIVVTMWTTCLPFYAAMKELLRHAIDDYSGAISLEAHEYSFYYIISSLSCWGFLMLTFLFILTFYRDMKRMKITMTLSPKLIKLDTVQTAPHPFNNEEITRL